MNKQYWYIIFAIAALFSQVTSAGPDVIVHGNGVYDLDGVVERSGWDGVELPRVAIRLKYRGNITRELGNEACMTLIFPKYLRPSTVYAAAEAINSAKVVEIDRKNLKTSLLTTAGWALADANGPVPRPCAYFNKNSIDDITITDDKGRRRLVDALDEYRQVVNLKAKHEVVGESPIGGAGR